MKISVFKIRYVVISKEELKQNTKLKACDGANYS